jgi:hypothetical protein
LIILFLLVVELVLVETAPAAVAAVAAVYVQRLRQLVAAEL